MTDSDHVKSMGNNIQVQADRDSESPATQRGDQAVTAHTTKAPTSFIFSQFIFYEESFSRLNY
jgi:hypothetical protein